MAVTLVRGTPAGRATCPAVQVPGPAPASPPAVRPTSTQRGRRAEDAACAHLRAAGLRLVGRNYRVARGPGRPGGEIDLILQAPGRLLVFVEVRARRSTSHGGAALSISERKLQHLRFAAAHYLAHWPGPPPRCRFDVVCVEGRGPVRVRWLPGAFAGPGAGG